MQAYIFNSLANAMLAQAAVDGPYGYPQAGRPLDARAVAQNTTTYTAIYRNAAGTAWAMLADSWTGPKAAIHAATAIPTSITIGPTGGAWAGAVQVWP